MMKSNSLTLKLALIVLLSIVLIIPVLWMQNTIHERERYYKKSLDMVSESWAGAQTIFGPFLLVPYVDTTDKKQTLKQYLFFPALLNAKAVMTPEVRHRGIFEVIVYQTTLHLEGQFSKYLKHVQGDKQFMWDQAKLILHISDLKGIQSLTWANEGHNLSVEPGTGGLSSTLPGLHAIPHVGKDMDFNFKISLQLKGTDALNFVPIGRDTRLEITSTWPDPSFTGHFLPLTRDITKSGFQATWHVPYLARSIPEGLDSKNFDFNKLSGSDSFGVRLIKTANHYQQAERAIKYFYMFILYTFVAFFLFEAVKKTKIHIFQYALAGSSLLCFFILLTAFAEHLSFSLAYLIAASAIVTQISLYTFKIIQAFRERFFFASIFIGLYGCLYIILHLEDYAFLIGALGLFGVLSLTMYYTRNVNWFENESRSSLQNASSG